jgi:hypothetical protein
VNLLSAINQFILLFVDTLRQAVRGRLWLPLLLYFLVQWLVLYAHYAFLDPPFYGIISSWISFFDPDQATAFGHYPQHFLLLGRYAGWAKMAVGLVLEGIVLGAVAAMFHQRFTGERLGLTGYRSWVMTWLNLIVVWVVLNGLLWAAGYFLPSFLSPYLTGPRRLMAFSYVFMPAVFTGIFALFFTAIPAIVVYGDNGFSALIRSIRLFFRRPFTLYALGMVILAVPVMLAALASRPGIIIDSFKPELVYWILTATLFSEMIAGFLWMGTAVRFFTEADT